MSKPTLEELRQKAREILLDQLDEHTAAYRFHYGTWIDTATEKDYQELYDFVYGCEDEDVEER